MATTVYTGVWIDRTHRAIQGATITLSARDGAVLTAAVATFVTVVMTQLWKIILYAAHQIRSTPRSRDGLFHQQQVVFRNSATPGAVAWSCLTQAFLWTRFGKCRNAAARCLCWSIVAIMYMTAAAVAAIFSSQVARPAGSLRLLNDDNKSCGTWNFDSVDTSITANFRTQGSARAAFHSVDYARECYGQVATNSNCQLFARQQLPYDIIRNGSCPFERKMCADATGQAFPVIEMVTPVLDSHTHFGSNAPLADRAGFRKRTVCSPINDSGQYTSYANGSELNSPVTTARDDIFLTFWYSEGHDYTYRHTIDLNYGGSGYSLFFNHTNQVANDGSQWNPIPELDRTDADLAFAFIANSALYTVPCDDPVFAAQGAIESVLGGPLYISNKEVGVIGCAEQYALCNTVTDLCSEFQNYHNFSGVLESKILAFSDSQKSTARRIRRAAQWASLFQTGAYSSRILKAQDTEYNLVQSYLPPNQWEIEALGWFDTGLAAMQREAQNLKARDYGSFPDGAVLTPYNDSMSCSPQLTRLTQDTVSFSALGLCLVAVLGLAIIMISVTMDLVFNFITEQVGVAQYARSSWRLNDNLHLHRMACTARGLGTWSGEDSAVPTTQDILTWIGWSGDEGETGNAQCETVAGPTPDGRDVDFASTPPMPRSKLAALPRSGL